MADLMFRETPPSIALLKLLDQVFFFLINLFIFGCIGFSLLRVGFL